ncbi:ATP-binding protein [Aquabacterium sp. A7-Y]|uniref:sensor histidine kinase n=1 Tax=Aquabacterium sp. A7-Y TaxID=1349605 RepID=UPI00223D92C8|nr:HAMP domain-containing sensor histidine kinase [Aquabacterium sp. A7-Y]MCW7541347.1 ATP-binding protein [Aquabacterium sp. A7-Y]
MRTSAGLRRQIVLWMGLLSVAVAVFSLLGFYAFYVVALKRWPGIISEGVTPSGAELGWMVGTTLAALVLTVVVAVKLSRRILAPLNAVAQSLRQVAKGNLAARARHDNRAVGEAAQLVHDFNAMAERLDHMARERTLWHAAIAHELRTPVTVLSGRLQGLSDGVFEAGEAQFRSLLTQVEGLGRLIEDLRVLGLEESGHLRLQLEETDLASEVASVVQAFEPRLRAAGFVLALDLDEPAVAVCDPVRIRQALLALLENALHHAVPGLLRICAGVDGGVCRLRVEDAGPGIDPALSSRVFDAFQRGEPTKPSGRGGSGLGLAVVRAIAQAHAGQASCRPSSTGGTVFEVAWQG